MQQGRIRHRARPSTSTIRRLVALVGIGLTLASCSGSRPDLADDTPTSTDSRSTTGVEATVVPDEAETGSILIDSFTEPGPLVGSNAELAWAIPSGDWRTVNGGLRHGGLIGALPSTAIIETGSPNGLVQATFSEAADWAGITFRYKDLANHWALVAAPNFGTWNLIKVVDGESFGMGNVGVAPVSGGTIVGVLLDGDRISVSVNAQTLLAVIDDTHAGATAAGVYAGRDTASNAIWDSFLVIPARPPEITSKAALSPPQLEPSPPATPAATADLPGFRFVAPTPNPTTDNQTEGGEGQNP